MVETQLALDGMSVVPRRRALARPKQPYLCATCEKPTWRAPSQLRGVRVFCSDACYRVAPRSRDGKVTIPCATCGADVVKFKSHVHPLTFCDKACSNAYKWVDVTCWWPNCNKRLNVRPSSGGKSGYAVYKTSFGRGSYHVRAPLCQEHVDHAIEVLGPKTRLGAIQQVIAHPEKPRSSRGVSKSLRFVVWTISNGCCEDCRCALDFNAPRGTWQVDHKVPVQSGGLTVISNLQALCNTCHNHKTRPEKTISAHRRHAGQKLGRWLTHREKDERMMRMEGEIAELKKAVLILFALNTAWRRNG